MPPIASKKQVLDRLYNLVSPSVVMISRSKNSTFVEFGTGFVIYSDRSIVLICLHEFVIKDGESVTVHFHDNTKQRAHVFMRIPSSRHVVIEVEAVGSRRREVKFAEYPVRMQNIFTIAAVQYCEELGLMTGTVSITNCRAVSQRGGYLMRGSENIFAMSCPAAGPSKIGEPKGEDLQLVGAAVFDMKGLVIGTIDSVDPNAYDLKFSRKTSSFLNNLELMLKASDAKIYLSRGHGHFTQGAGTSRQKGSTSGSGSRKRGHEDSAGGGTRTEKGLCMDQVEVNVEMVSQKKRLHKYPVQGDMEVARREAMRLALVRLVTRESDDQLRGSSSSPDAGIEANECMKVFIARNPDELGSENSISVKPFDLNHFFGEDGKIYGYKNLKIIVWISAISFHAYADISFLEKSDGGKGITDLKPALLNIFGENLVEKDEFVQTFSKECQYISGVVTDGRVLKHAASNDEDSAVEIVRVELQGAAAFLYSRLVPLVLLLVEGSTTIDIKEHGWEMLLVVKKATRESSTPKFQLLGFAAARHFYHYPESTHLRISQILVLPPYQGECHGRHLIEAINSIAISENIYDVTIEDPPDYLQHIHSSIDCLRLLTFDPIKPVLSAMVSSLKEIKLSERTCGLIMVPPADLAETVRLKLKMSMKQFLRCWEILMYLNLDAEDHESMDKLRACIYDRVKGEILGNPTGKQVASSLDDGTSLALCCSKEEQRAEDVKAQEEELNELVDKQLEEIAKVTKNLVHRFENWDTETCMRTSNFTN